MRKGEITYNKPFLLFSQCFLPFMVLIFHFKCALKCHLKCVSIWTSLKFCRLVMGYRRLHSKGPKNCMVKGQFIQRPANIRFCITSGLPSK